MRTKLFTVLLIFCLMAVGVARFFFPYGSRSCFLPCTALSLRLYAAANGGWFPTASGPTNALQQLVPEYMEDPDYLAGISGDRKKMRTAWQKRGYLGTNDSSWVYLSGFRDDDEPAVAIIWESMEGVALNGFRRDGHAVGFSDGTTRQIPSSEWNAFLKAQDQVRADAVRNRRSEKQNHPDKAAPLQ